MPHTDLDTLREGAAPLNYGSVTLPQAQSGASAGCAWPRRRDTTASSSEALRHKGSAQAEFVKHANAGVSRRGVAEITF